MSGAPIAAEPVRDFRVGHEQQIVDEPLHPEVFLEEVVRRRPPHFGAVGAVAGQDDLEFVADDGDRGAEFVRRVRDEPVLSIARSFEPVEHLVHRRRQSADLVVAWLVPDSTVEVVASDAGDLGMDCLDGVERGPTRSTPWWR